MSWDDKRAGLQAAFERVNPFPHGAITFASGPAEAGDPLVSLDVLSVVEEYSGTQWVSNAQGTKDLTTVQAELATVQLKVEALSHRVHPSALEAARRFKILMRSLAFADALVDAGLTLASIETGSIRKMDYLDQDGQTVSAAAFDFLVRSGSTEEDPTSLDVIHTVTGSGCVGPENPEIVAPFTVSRI